MLCQALAKPSAAVRRLLALVSSVICGGLPVWEPALVLASPPAPDYELLFADEFNGSTHNASNWAPRTGPRTGTGIDGLNLERNLSFADGHLIITARQEVIDGKPAHTGGGLISRHRFGYGYYEVRSRPFMEGRGVHTAFWQRGMGGPENNSIFEIDSHEIDSTQKIACNNLYVDVSTKGYMELAWPHRGQVPLHLPADGWWIDAYEYTPDGVIFYDDGVQVARADFPDLVAAQNVWLTALNGVGRVDAAKQPGETRFDYFRYYARDFPGATLLPNGGFEYNQDKISLDLPVAWLESGDAGACRVVRGEAFHGDFKLRQSSDRPFSVTATQTLHYIRNGNYELRARVRRQGQHSVARIRVSGHGGQDLSVDLPASASWTDIRLPAILVTTHQVTVALNSAGGPDDWVELDEVQFLKPPLPGKTVRPSRSFAFQPNAPIWEIAARRPIDFKGDEKFYFFGRNVGIGDAVTVSFTLQPQKRIDTFPLTRMPKTGNRGWGVGLSKEGAIFFRLGSHADHFDLVVPNGYREGAVTRVTCVFDRGSAAIYLDGRLRKRTEGIMHAPMDPTAPGRLGANSGLYDAAGDVTLTADAPPSPSTRFQNYIGTIGDVRVYNRALSSDEIAR